METNEFLVELVVREKLEEARAATARRALVLAARPPRPALRARLGVALILLGERLCDAPTPGRACAGPNVSRG